MKLNQFFLLAALSTVIFACTNPPADQAATTTPEPAPADTGKGVLSITTATELTTADYDKVSAELKTSGEWMKDWTYHAIGTIQPKGFFSIGVYPNQAAFDHRRGIFKELFVKFSINAPAPQVHEVQKTIVGAQPAGKPAAAFVAAFSQTGMSAGIYADVLAELEAAGVGAPAGRMYHVCYMTNDGGQVIDVWESEALFKAFGDVLMPILQAKGVKTTPAIYPLYNSVVVK